MDRFSQDHRGLGMTDNTLNLSTLEPYRESEETLTDEQTCDLIREADPFQSGLDVGIEIDVDWSDWVRVDREALKRLAFNIGSNCR